MRILAVSRAERFSPNSVERDRAIFQAVIDRLQGQGHEVRLINEDHLDHQDNPESTEHPDLILTMARKPETLRWLESFGAGCINSSEGIANCAKSRLSAVMERIGTPVPPHEGTDGYWLKRGDAAAQTSDDVVYLSDRQQLETAIQAMRSRGITDYVVSAHVVGDLVKFYGVGQGDFFRWYYPTDDGQTKFGDECRNGSACHYPFQVGALQQEVQRLAAAVGVSVYGGDAIVRADGSFCLIDFNDWPSFSRCRDAAADAIASLVINRKIELA
jgi:hypothetical protein